MRDEQAGIFYLFSISRFKKNVSVKLYKEEGAKPFLTLPLLNIIEYTL